MARMLRRTVGALTGLAALVVVLRLFRRAGPPNGPPGSPPSRPPSAHRTENLFEEPWKRLEREVEEQEREDRARRTAARWFPPVLLFLAVAVVLGTLAAVQAHRDGLLDTEAVRAHGVFQGRVAGYEHVEHDAMGETRVDPLAIPYEGPATAEIELEVVPGDTPLIVPAGERHRPAPLFAAAAGAVVLSGLCLWLHLRVASRYRPAPGRRGLRTRLRLTGTDLWATGACVLLLPCAALLVWDLNRLPPGDLEFTTGTVITSEPCSGRFCEGNDGTVRYTADGTEYTVGMSGLSARTGVEIRVAYFRGEPETGVFARSVPTDENSPWIWFYAAGMIALAVFNRHLPVRLRG